MTILCTLLVVAVIALIGVGAWRERVHRLVVADLLDRVMARSYGEYVASNKVLPGRPVRRRVMTDEELAELERSMSGSGEKV